MANIVRYNNVSSGLAKSKWRGPRGSYAKAVGIDIHSEPGVIKAQFKLAKDSGNTVVDKILAVVFTSGGHSYWFGDAGKIYKRTSGGTWSVLATVTSSPKILGAAEHSDGFVYFTYTNKVGRIKVSDDTITEDWNTLDNTNTNYGAVIYHEKKDKIFIGNQNQVAQIDEDSSFTANTLDLLDVGYEIRDISWIDLDVLIGATDTRNNNKSRIFLWDGFSSSWQYSWLFSQEIKWIQNQGDLNYIMAGNKGRVYEFLGSALDLRSPITRIPGAYSSTATFESNQNAKVVFNGLLHFAVHDAGAGNPFPNGVYTYGTQDIENQPRALNCEYVISPDKVTGIEIGVLGTDGSNLYVAWKDSSTYGVDKIDFTVRYATSYIEFLVMGLKKELKKIFISFPTEFKPLPSSCSVQLLQKVDDASSFTSVKTVNTSSDIDDQESFNGAGVVDGKLIQTKLILGVSSANTPEILEHAIIWEDHEFE